MDEILIDEKRYVSSKRAAKITGYAKDYIGQLCREGRVPARLVGRSWYVLESAIEDHRFGATDGSSVDKGQDTENNGQSEAQASVEPDIAGTTRYETPVEEEVYLPTVNRLRAEDSETAEEEVVTPNTEVNKPPEHIQEAWKSWFERVGEIPAPSPVIEHVEEPIKTEKKEEEREEAVNVPVHAIYRQPPEELLPLRKSEQIIEESPAEPVVLEVVKPSSRAVVGAVRIASVFIAVITLFIATIGSGAFDDLVISYTHARALAGISVYNK